MRAGHGVDELRCDADTIAAPPDAALQYVACAQFPPDLPNIDRLSLVLEGRISRDDQSSENRDSSVVRSSVIPSLKYSCLVAAEVIEGQHRDGWPMVSRAFSLIRLGIK